MIDGSIVRPTLPCKDARGRRAARLEFQNVMMAREPKIAYVMLRNAHFGPRLAASVELCVRDLVVHSRYARTTLVVCPPVDEPFEGIEIATIPDAAISGNLGKAWGVARLLRRRGVDLAIVENHLPAAAFIALTSGARVILHTHAYVKAPSSALDGAFRRQEMRRLSGFAFVSEYALGQFRADFPGLRPPSAPSPTGSTCKPGRRRNRRTGRSSASAGRSGTRATSRRWRRSRVLCLRGPNGAPASWCPTRRPPTGSRRPSTRFATRPSLSTAGSGSIRTFPMPRSRRRGSAPQSEWC